MFTQYISVVTGFVLRPLVHPLHPPHAWDNTNTIQHAGSVGLLVLLHAVLLGNVGQSVATRSWLNLFPVQQQQDGNLWLASSVNYRRLES